MTQRTTSIPSPSYRHHQLRMLVLAGVAFFASAPGQSFLISVFVDDFLRDTGISRTAFAGLYAAGTVVSALAMLGLGRVIDGRGLRAAWCVVAVAMAVACGLASVATGALLAFFALALLRTSGQGSFTLVGTLLVARSFDRRRGQAMATATLGITLASVVLPPLVALLILQVGWRATYQVIALVVLVVVLPLAGLVRTGPARAQAEDGAPKEPATQPPPVTVTRRGLPNLPSAQVTRLLLVLAAPPLIGTAVTFHAVSILAERDIGFLAAGGVIGVLGATSGLGVIAAGLLVDRIPTRTALTLLGATMLTATLVLLIPTPAAAYISFAVLGLTMGGVGVVNGTVWARTFGTTGLGRLQGMAQSSMITAAAVAPLIPALSQSATGSYYAGLIALSVVAATSLVLARLPDPGHHGRGRGHSKVQA